MPVGATIGSSHMDNMITSAAVHLRDVCQDISELSLSVNGQGTGLAYLESLDFGSAPNPENPGGISDAAYALSMISYENTVAGVYFGTAAQPSDFDFSQELSQLWNRPISTGLLSPLITELAVRLQDAAVTIANLNLSVNGQGQGLNYLISIGYSNTPDAANPGGVSDAALALSTIGYEHTVAAVYFGQAAQSPAYNFHQQLSSVWAGQVAV
jgi:hypothetical protein